MLISKFLENNKIINKIIEFLNNNYEEIETSKGNEQLKEIIKEFKLKYFPYKNCQRFSIPIIGNISSGKSTFINYLLRLNKVLEVKDRTTTKCICIIRHKKENKTPKIYNVKIKYREDNNNDYYDFVPDQDSGDLGDDVAKIISDKNKEIEEKGVGNNIEKYFLIIEYDIPFFRGEFEQYADLFEFMDVPGLNEPNKNTTENNDDKKIIKDKNQTLEELSDNDDKNANEINEKNNNNKKESEKLTNIYYKEIFPFIKMNIKLCLFIFDAENYQGNDALLILKTYLSQDIEKYEEIKNEIQKINSGEYDNEKEFEKLYLIKQKDKMDQIDYISSQTFINSIFLLNKVNLIKDENDRKNANNIFIDYMTKKFAKDESFVNRIKNFCLNEENEKEINARKLLLENAKMDSFEDYLIYYIEYSEDYKNHSNNFLKYIIKQMNKEFELNLKYEDSDNSDSEEENYEIPNDKSKLDNFITKNCPDFMKEKDFRNFIEINKEKNKNHDFFDGFMSPKKYMQLKKIFKKSVKNYKKIQKKKKVEIMIQNKMKKIIDDYLDIHKYIGLEKDIIKDLKINVNKSKSKLQEALEKMKKNKQGIEDPLKVVSSFDEEIKKMLTFEKESTILDEIKKRSDDLKDYFINTSSIKILLVGPHSSGKSTFLNNLIGYNRKLLPSQSQECTKTCVIIKYSEEKEVKLFKTTFIQNELGYNFFKYDEKDLIAEGEANIFEKLNYYNNLPDIKDNFLFFILQTPIEFFDMMNLSKEEKNKIELLDFPGLDTKFENAQETAKKLLLIIDGFIYLNSRITFQADDQKILQEIIFKSINKRETFSLETCLFIINKIDIIKSFDEELPLIKEEILTIFDKCYNGYSLRDTFKKKQEIHTDSLILQGFSAHLYEEYLKFSYEIEHFEEFLLKNMEKNQKDEEEKSVFVIGFLIKKIKSIKKIILGQNEIEMILENMKEKYLKIHSNQLKNYEFDVGEIKQYVDRIKKLEIENIENIKYKDIEKIVKLYIYLKNHKKEINAYKHSRIDELLHQTKNVISNVTKFFHQKKVIYALNFLEALYIQIFDYYTIRSLKKKNPNIFKFKELNDKDIISKIESKFNGKSKKIKNLFNDKSETVLDRINNCNGKSNFNDIVSKNKKTLDDLLDNAKDEVDKFEKFLKEKSDEINEKFNLKEFEKQKEEFIRNMKEFKQANVGNKISGSSSSYIKTKKFFFFFDVFDEEKTVKEYKTTVENFLEDSKNEFIRVLRQNMNKAKSKIKNLFELINGKIENFNGNIEDLKKLVEHIELKIYETLGINN